MVTSLVITRTQMCFYLAARRVVNVFPLRLLGSVRVPRVAFGVVRKQALNRFRLSRLARTGRSATRESFRSRQHARRARYLTDSDMPGLGGGLGRGLGVVWGLGVGVGLGVEVTVAVGDGGG